MYLRVYPFLDSDDLFYAIITGLKQAKAFPRAKAKRLKMVETVKANVIKVIVDAGGSVGLS